MHEYYYHPSNTSFMFYGNSDIDSKLQMLGENYLRNYSNEEGRYRKKIEVEEVRQMYSDSYS